MEKRSARRRQRRRDHRTSKKLEDAESVSAGYLRLQNEKEQLLRQAAARNRAKQTQRAIREAEKSRGIDWREKFKAYRVQG
jgi:hypothetical protein